jgi:hypothetical protein
MEVREAKVQELANMGKGNGRWRIAFRGHWKHIGFCHGEMFSFEKEEK